MKALVVPFIISQGDYLKIENRLNSFDNVTAQVSYVEKFGKLYIASFEVYIIKL